MTVKIITNAIYSKCYIGHSNLNLYYGKKLYKKLLKLHLKNMEISSLNLHPGKDKSMHTKWLYDVSLIVIRDLLCKKLTNNIKYNHEKMSLDFPTALYCSHCIARVSIYSLWYTLLVVYSLWYTLLIVYKLWCTMLIVYSLCYTLLIVHRSRCSIPCW